LGFGSHDAWRTIECQAISCGYRYSSDFFIILLSKFSYLQIAMNFGQHLALQSVDQTTPFPLPDLLLA
jgi:hypothetical protein